ITRNLGDEVYFRLIEPFCSGVYSGDPTQLSMKAAFYKIWVLEKEGGSLVGGALRLFNQNRKNPGPPRDPRLPPKPKVSVTCLSLTNWKLVDISKDASTGLTKLRYSTPEGNRNVSARHVVLTAPAWVLADLLKQSAGVTTLGTIYSSSLFPGRAGPGEILLLNYIGGVTNRGIVDQTHEQLVAQVDKDLRVMLLKPDAPAPKVVGVRVWPRAIPQFNLGHLDKVS
ncbi:protoporphyrinogen oxidase, partial [Haematococcus lacustris]